jgi:hypothetical protein
VSVCVVVYLEWQELQCAGGGVNSWNGWQGPRFEDNDKFSVTIYSVPLFTV